MNERNQKVEALFHAVLELESAAVRERYLHAACGTDAELRREVEELLQSARAAEPIFQSGPAAKEAATVAEQPGSVIGRYKLLEKIGEGGCGVVYMAEQEEPVRRRVALKIIKPGMDSRQVIARFEAERQALALMDHPNIAKVFDGGVTGQERSAGWQPAVSPTGSRQSVAESKGAEQSLGGGNAESPQAASPAIQQTASLRYAAGRPYFVMELVRGIRITDYCKQHNLSTRERLDLFMQVCSAIQHAHQKGVIHRDIKPSNVLVTENDGKPVPKVIDFGIAKATEQKLTDKTLFTQFAAFIGTPAYMSPEQAEMSSLDIDTRSDIYSLGVLLYELHTGTTPFDTQELLKAGFDEMRRVIRETEPERPSTRLTALQGRKGETEKRGNEAQVGSESPSELVAADVRRLKSKSEIRDPKTEEEIRASSRRLLQIRETIHQLRGDLDWIVMKCLEKDRARRYETANGLAADIQRHLSHEPVVARPPSAAYRIQKMVRRNTIAFAATAAVIVALAAGAVVSTWQAVRAIRAQRAADMARDAEKQERQRAEQGELAARTSELSARQFAYASDVNLAHQAVQEDDFYRALQLLDRHRPAGERESGIRGQESGIGKQKPDRKLPLRRLLTPDLRGWEWRYLWRQCQGEERFILGEHANGATVVGLLADGKTVFSAGRDKLVRLWDLESRRQIGLLPHAEAVIGAAASPDGRWLATASGKEAEAQPVLLWDLATQKIAATLTTNFWLRAGSITFSPDNQWLAFHTHFGGVRIWEVNARSEVTTLPASSTSITPRGLTFSPDSHTLAYNENESGAIVLWDIGSRSVIGRISGHQSAVTVLAFSPDGQTLASGSDDRSAKLWNLAERRVRLQFTNHSGGITSLAFSPDGRTFAMSGAGGAGRVIRLLDIETGNQKAERRGHLKGISSLAFTPDGQTLLSASDDSTIRVWDPVPHRREKSADTFARNSISTAWSSYGPALCLAPDGRHLLTVYTNQTFSVWDTLRLAEGARHPLPFINTTIAAVAPGGRLAAFASRRGEVTLWDAEMGQPRFFARSVTNLIRLLVFSPDGRYLAAAVETSSVSQMAGSNDDPRRTVRVWDVGAQKETHVLSTDGEFPKSLTFSANAKALMVGCWRGPVKLWQLDGPGGAATFLGHSGEVRGLALLPDGQSLISAGADAHIRFWDVRTSRETDKLNPREGWFSGLALSPDGRRLAAGASDGLITIWDTASHQEVATLDGHKKSVMHLAFTPDGDHLVSVSKDQLRVWHAASRSEADAAAEKEARK